MSFDSSTYDAFENETVVVVRCTITGSLSQPSDVRVSALPYLQDSPAQGEFLNKLLHTLREFFMRKFVGSVT